MSSGPSGPMFFIQFMHLFQDLRALLLVFSVQRPTQLSALLEDSLLHIQRVCGRIQGQRRARQEAEAKQREEEEEQNSEESDDDDDDDDEDVKGKE